MAEPTNILELDRRHIWHPYTQAQTAPEPIEIVAGRGAVLVGADGAEYLDLISSWWVNTHGHGHPAIARAIAEQASRLEQVIFTEFTHRPAVQLAARLVELLPPDLDRIFYSDDGSTAVEVALKIVFQYWRNRGRPERRRFLSFAGGFHGDTFGAMSAGRSSGFFGAFEPLLFEVDALPFPETWEGDQQVDGKERAALEALEAHLEADGGDRVAAVIVEPLVQGAAGMRMCRPSFLRELAAAVRGRTLLVADEVMTGFGRTGAMFACQRAGVTPDLICLAKGLTGGFLPLAVTACAEPIFQAFLGQGFDRALAHGHSFAANPLGCAAALASLQLFEEEQTLGRVSAIERLHRERLSALAGHTGVRRVRMTGSIAALDLEVPDAGYTSTVGAKLKRFFVERRLLLRPLGNVIYLLPPYCISDAELHRAWDAIEEAVDHHRPR